MVDKRTVKRRHLIYYLSIFDSIFGRIFGRNADQLVGQLVDISGRGVMLTSEYPVEKGADG